MKTLYVHIGTPKTGSTAIRKFCWENREVFRKSGYNFPDMREVCPGITVGRNGYFLIDVSDGPGHAESEGKNRYRTGMDIVGKLFDTYDNIILSDEHIYRSTHKVRETLWEELKEDGNRYGFQVKIIVYLRRQDSYVESFWKQNVKRRRIVTTWDEYVSRLPQSFQLDYYEKLESIAAVLGKENVIVRRFQRGTFFGGSIYADFLHAVGLEMTGEYTVSEETENPGLKGSAHEILRIINGLSSLDEEDMELMRNTLLAIGDYSAGQYPTSLFSQQECRDFLARYEEGNRRVAAEYLGEPDTGLFSDTISELPKWTKDNPYMLNDVICFAAMGMSQLRRENEALREEIREVRGEFRSMKEKIKDSVSHPVRAVGRRLGISRTKK